MDRLLRYEVTVLSPDYGLTGDAFSLSPGTTTRVFALSKDLAVATAIGHSPYLNGDCIAVAVMIGLSQLPDPIC